MDNDKKIKIFNSLIVINNDRIEGYKSATSEAKETDLKMLFADLMQTSVENRKELVKAVNELGGTPDEGTRITGKFFRVWMDMKAAFSGSDRKVILDSCEYGEDTILNTYKKVSNESLEVTDSDVQMIVKKHYTLLKADHDKVKKLRDAIANEKNEER